MPKLHMAAFVVAELCIGILLATLSVVVARHPGPLPGDVGLAHAIQSLLLPHTSIASGIEFISVLNWPKPSVITLAIISGVFLVLRRWLDTVIVIFTAAASAEANYALSQFIHRPRPSDHGIHVLRDITNYYSFPSGHVVYATAVYGLFFFLTYQVRHAVHPLILWLVRIVSAIVITLMPISRILEGEHWPTDTLGGILFGMFWLLIAAHLYDWMGVRWPSLRAPDEQ